MRGSLPPMAGRALLASALLCWKDKRVSVGLLLCPLLGFRNAREFLRIALVVQSHHKAGSPTAAACVSRQLELEKEYL